jgi:hypothetical protein
MITEVKDGKRTRTYEAEDFVQVIGRYIPQLETLAREEDPWVVADMLRLQAELEAATLRTVKHMRDTGVTWKTIGFNLGLNAIQCHKKFATKINAL